LRGKVRTIQPRNQPKLVCCSLVQPDRNQLL